MDRNVKIKICGLTRPEDIEAANSILPDYIGFVFWPKSKRNLSKEKAAQLKELLDERIQSVGVFVDADQGFICELVSCGIIDIVQLHGSEDEEYIQSLRKRLSTVQNDIQNDNNTKLTSIIKAFEMTKTDALEAAEKSTADYVMLDAGKGSGHTFDWSRLENFSRPYFLAGGLSCENISEVVSNITPYAVDVSSGVETDGVKDPEKMKQFVELCKPA